MVKNIKKYKRESEAIWVAEAMRSETRRVLRSKPKKHKEDEEDIENKEEFEEKEKEERPFFPEYQLDLVRAAFKAAKSEGKEIPLHNPNLKYTAKDVGRVIRVLERAGLEARLGYIAGVVEKIEGSDSGRLYVLLKKGYKLEKQYCWFYSE